MNSSKAVSTFNENMIMVSISMLLLLGIHKTSGHYVSDFVYSKKIYNYFMSFPSDCICSLHYIPESRK